MKSDATAPYNDKVFPRVCLQEIQGPWIYIIPWCSFFQEFCGSVLRDKPFRYIFYEKSLTKFFEEILTCDASCNLKSLGSLFKTHSTNFLIQLGLLCWLGCLSEHVFPYAKTSNTIVTKHIPNHSSMQNHHFLQPER